MLALSASAKRAHITHAHAHHLTPPPSHNNNNNANSKEIVVALQSDDVEQMEANVARIAEWAAAYIAGGAATPAAS